MFIRGLVIVVEFLFKEKLGAGFFELMFTWYGNRGKDCFFLPMCFKEVLIM